MSMRVHKGGGSRTIATLRRTILGDAASYSASKRTGYGIKKDAGIRSDFSTTKNEGRFQNEKRSQTLGRWGIGRLCSTKVNRQKARK